MTWTPTPPTIPGLYISREWWIGPKTNYWGRYEFQRVESAELGRVYSTESGGVTWWLGPLPETPEDGSRKETP